MDNNVNYHSQFSADKVRLMRNRYWKDYVYKMALVFLAVFVIILQRNIFQKVEQKTFELLKEKRELQAYILPLRMEDRFLFRPERVEKIAKERFKMIEPSADNIIIVK